MDEDDNDATPNKPTSYSGFRMTANPEGGEEVEGGPAHKLGQSYIDTYSNPLKIIPIWLGTSLGVTLFSPASPGQPFWAKFIAHAFFSMLFWMCVFWWARSKRY